MQYDRPGPDATTPQQANAWPETPPAKTSVDTPVTLIDAALRLLDEHHFAIVATVGPDGAWRRTWVVPEMVLCQLISRSI